MPTTHFHIAVLGCDLQAAAIAREAAASGLSVLMLCDKDLGQEAGFGVSLPLNCNLTRLDHLAVTQVARNIREERRLSHIASPWVTPCRYYVPASPAVRSRKRVQLGLSVFKRFWRPNGPVPGALPGTSASLTGQAAAPLTLAGAPQRYDTFCLNEQRLLMAHARGFKALKGRLITHSPVISATRGTRWQLQTASNTFSANILINCTGTQVGETATRLLNSPSRCAVTFYDQTLVLARKLYRGDHGYVLQMQDNHFLYVTPVDSQTVILGPLHSKDKAHAQALIDCYNHWFHTPLSDADILKSLQRHCAAYDDPSQYKPAYLPNTLLDLNAQPGAAALLNVFGADATKHQLLAERALKVLRSMLPVLPARPLKALTLPGADITHSDMPAFYSELQAAYHHLPANLLRRLAYTYGQDAYALLQNSNETTALGQYFGHSLYAQEVQYLLHNEWARTAADILKRRTSLKHHFSAEQAAALSDWIKAHR